MRSVTELTGCSQMVEDDHFVFQRSNHHFLLRKSYVWHWTIWRQDSLPGTVRLPRKYSNQFSYGKKSFKAYWASSPLLSPNIYQELQIACFMAYNLGQHPIGLNCFSIVFLKRLNKRYLPSCIFSLSSRRQFIFMITQIVGKI